MRMPRAGLKTGVWKSPCLQGANSHLMERTPCRVARTLTRQGFFPTYALQTCPALVLHYAWYSRCNLCRLSEPGDADLAWCQLRGGLSSRPQYRSPGAPRTVSHLGD